MLEKGSHKAFSEFFNLIQQQKLQHQRAGAAAVLLEPLIDNDHAKLEYLSVHLSAAEEAERRGDFRTSYLALRKLAEFFKQNQGSWLAFHFYQRSLETTSQITGDNQKCEGEGHCNMGLSLEERGKYAQLWHTSHTSERVCWVTGELQQAAHHLEVYQKLAYTYKWHTDSGDSSYTIVSEHLRRVYTNMAEKVHTCMTV